MNPRMYKEGKYIIRLDGFGHKTWSYNGKTHRENGPAEEYLDGTKVWFINGLRHREDGPAIEGASGRREWWLNNAQYTEEEWKFEMRRRKLELLGL